MTHRSDKDRIPDSSHYSMDYVCGDRIHSFAHQLLQVLRLEPTSVLEIGVGAGIVTSVLRQLGISVTTMDIERSVEPDIVASVMDMPIDDGGFDVGLCCQVLEHMRFEMFGDALAELHRVVRRALVLSLPDVTRYLELSCYLPLLGRRQLACGLPRIRRRKMPASRLEEMGHYWEIGFDGYPLRKVLAEAQSAGWRCRNTWRVPELPWHRFFLLYGE